MGRLISLVSWQAVRANSGVMTAEEGMRRRYKRSNAERWLAFRPLICPWTVGIAVLLGNRSSLPMADCADVCG